jgi:hypothetical protein
MRRELEWFGAGLVLIGFAVATAQARIETVGASPVVLDLSAPGTTGVVLKLDVAPEMMLSSLPAADEQELFGIEPEPPVVAEVEPAPRALAVVQTRTPLKRAKMRKQHVPAARTAVAAVAPDVVRGAVAPSLVELDVPATTPGRAVAFAEEAPASQLSRERLGFRLNERTSIGLAPLSSVVPSYAAEAGHGDVGERWRLHDDRDAAKTGAAVGMTFKLN